MTFGWHWSIPRSICGATHTPAYAASYFSQSHVSVGASDFYGIANNSVEGHDLDVGSTAPHEGDGE